MSENKPRDLDTFLARMRKQFQTNEEALTDIHKEAIEDWKFRLGGDENVWDATVLAERKDDGRPIFSVNRVPQFLRQVTGQQKSKKPAIQISPIGDNSDEETAKIEQGMVRHIERTGDAEDAVDLAFEHMLTGGFGFIRLVTDYSDDESFDQDIKFERVLNPFAHFPDARCKKRDYSDARNWFVIEDMDKDDYQEQYPDSDLASISEWGDIANQAPTWIQQNSVRVAEYYWVEEQKVTVKKGQRTREKLKRTVHWCKTNGIEILEETDVPGDFIPIAPVLGEEITLQGKRHLIGLVRYARTPQKLYNLWTSALAEAIAMAPKAPYMATPAQIEGYEDIWETANTSNHPYLPVNPDPKAPGWPQRQDLEPAIQAIAAALAHADNDLKATFGIYDASLGKPGPEQSGKAILLRKEQGDASTFGFQDALAPAIKQCGRIIIGWIPFYYDAPRIVRIVNPDGTSKLIPINQPFQDDAGLQKVFDVTVGKFDVSVDMGLSYKAAREEAANSIMQLVQADPALMNVVGDLLVKCMDWPLADEIADRLKKMLPPQLQEDAASALPQAQAKLAQAQQMIQQLSQTVHKLVDQKMAKLPELASRERIALIQAKAGIIEAAMKAQSQEAIVAFQADLEQIDRQLALLPDPGMETQNGGGTGTPQPAAPQMQPQPQQQPLAA
jgi:hypothetical protein